MHRDHNSDQRTERFCYVFAKRDFPWVRLCSANLERAERMYLRRSFHLVHLGGFRP
jgi:hypothetical protein